MQKNTRARSCPSSAIYLVQENGTLPILKPHLAPVPMPELVKPFPQKKSPAATRHPNQARRSRTPGKRASLALVSPATVLRELFELLEEYAPIWYTDDNHNRAVAALAQIAR